LPVFFLSILLMIKNNVGESYLEQDVIEPTFPSNSEAFTPLAFADYVTALQAQRVCEGAGAITGMPNGQYDWQVPFVRCDSTKCTENTKGQSALPFCEYHALAIAASSAADKGGKLRSEKFRDYIHRVYPFVDPSVNISRPFSFPFVKMFDSSKDLDSYVESKNYEDFSNPKIAFAVVWDGNDVANYQYSLRQNSTMYNVPNEESRPAALTTPPTTQKFDSYARNDESCPIFNNAPSLGRRGLSCTGQYLYNGLIPIHQLVNDFILEDSGAAAKNAFVARNGVRFVPFPTRRYEDGGVYSNFSGTS
jgi:hypothetical protein